MKTTIGHFLLQAGIAITLALLTALPADANLAQTMHLLVKLDPETWLQPERTLSAYPFETWTPLLVPGWVRVSASDGQSVRTLAEIESDPNVLAIEEDHRVRAALTPDDVYWSQQWGPIKVNAPGAWNVTTGRNNVVVAVLDTGVDLDHADLADQLWVNTDEVPSNNIDDDGNGKVDDINGWRFSPSESEDVNDDHGHGTHVAGIVAARGNNGLGIAGMAWGCQVMVVKVLDHEGEGSYSDVANGLIYAVDNGAQIANLSLGGEEPSQAMEDAVNYAYAHGTLVIAAAGNTNSAVLYPAAYQNALAVAASDQDDQRAGYSCYGPEMDLTAPGTSIYSTCMGGGYCYKSGTSMATPHVSGLAALIWSECFTYTVTQIAQQMLYTAQDIGSPGLDPYTGWGRINAHRALSDTIALSTLYLPLLAHDSTLSWPELRAR